jgi:hypothetical protein
MKTLQEKYDFFAKKNQEAETAGGADKLAKQHKDGKLERP